jgi:NAD-dependent dihydropyrimidine dehydrogenase PreA subunit
MDPEELLAGVPRDRVHWHPTIDYEICHNCLACHQYCPHGVYTLVEGRITVTNLAECVLLCNNCEPKCPMGAISFPTHNALFREIRAVRRAG